MKTFYESCKRHCQINSLIRSQLETPRRADQLSNGAAGAHAPNYGTTSTGFIPVTLPPVRPADFAQPPCHY